MTAVMFLLVLTVRATVVLACAGLLTLALRRASAASRHLVWSSALVGILLMPMAMVAGPGWALPGISLGARLPSPVQPVIEGAVPAQADPAREAIDRTSAANTPSVPAAAIARAALPTAVALALTISDSLSDSLKIAAVSPEDFVLGAWLFGLLICLAWLVLGLVRLRRLTGLATPVLNAGWRAELDAARKCLSLRREVTLLSGVGTPVPLTWGTLRPVVLLPDDAERWTADRRRVVLLHELGHVRRCDCSMQQLGRLICAIHWFNPLVWLATRQLGREREQACDELVIACGTRASDYAEQLLSFARPQRAAGWPAAVAMPMARSSHLEARLRAILNPRVPRPPRGLMTPAIVVLTVTVLVFAVATVHPDASAAPQSPAATRPSATAAPIISAQTSPQAPPAMPAPPSTAVAAPAAPVPSPTPHDQSSVGDAPTASPLPQDSAAAAGSHRREHAGRQRRDRQEQFDRTIDQLSRKLQQRLDRLQPLLDNLHVRVDIDDDHGRAIGPEEISQAVQEALEDTDLKRLAREAAAEASVDVADTITDAVADALRTLPESLEHLHVCVDSAPSCSPKRRH